jgi:Icc-related predicted phosphoesterase
MRFVTISDTHGQHEALQLPPGDVLLHAGDVSGRGKPEEVLSFVNWFAVQPFEHKIFIAGNHDFYFEKETAVNIQAILPEGITYLNDSGTTINGIHIWGSPVTPWFFDWAFNRQRGADIQRHWDLIPANTDILLTHGPVYGILDQTTRGERVGCQDLLAKVRAIKPRFCICGHIHEGYGMEERDGTVFINASVLDERYRLVHEPVEFDV